MHYPQKAREMLSALHLPLTSSHVNQFIARETTQLHLNHKAKAMPVTYVFKISIATSGVQVSSAPTNIGSG